VIKIGEFAKICNVSAQTLRYYDAEGVLKADVVDSSSGYRFYSIDAVDRYKKILFYKNLGFSLEEIKALQESNNDQIIEIFNKKKEEISSSINSLHNKIKILDSICNKAFDFPPLTESLLLPFDDDPQVIGKWKLCGKLFNEKDLKSLDTSSSILADNEIIFMPGGAFGWKYFWTKGILYRITSKYKFAIPNPYKIIKKANASYMIVQFMTDNCIDNGDDAVLLLYRQIDNNYYTEHQIRPNIDKTDFPFINDEKILGEWNTCDLVPTVDDFDPNLLLTDKSEIYTLKFQFLSRGICIKTIRSTSGIFNQTLRYTKGIVINDKEMTAEEYIIKTINKKEFLFVQHKSGDYIYGGKAPYWYVFTRKE